STSRAIWTKVLRGNPSTTTSGMSDNSRGYEFAARKSRNWRCAQSIFSPPWPSFSQDSLRRGGARSSCPVHMSKGARSMQRRDRGEVHRSGRKRTSTDEHREPTLSRAIHVGLRKVGFDVIRSRVTKERGRAKRTRSRGQVALLRTTTRRRTPRTCSSRRRRVCDQFTTGLRSIHWCAFRLLGLAVIGNTGPHGIDPLVLVT